MTQQIINNGESGATVRTKLNDNFTELYAASANPYPRVLDYASLPLASSVPGAIYIVETSTGVWPFRRSAGLWISNGSSWAWLGNESLIAEQIAFTPAGSISSVNVQAAIVEVAAEAAPLNRGIPSGGTTNQVLGKVSGTDYDVSWQTPSGGGSAPLAANYQIVKLLAGGYIANATTALALSTQSQTANTMRISPVIFPFAVNVDQLGVSISTAGAAATTCKVLIYDADSNGLPTTLLLESGTIATDAVATVYNTLGSPFSFTANKMYYIGVWTSGAPTLRAIGAGGHPALGWTTGGTPAGNRCAVRTLTYGTANNWPTFANSQLMSTVSPALVMMRVS